MGAAHTGVDPKAEEARAKIETFVGAGGGEGIAREARGRLFPASLWTDNKPYGSDWQKIWSKGRLVAHPRVLAFFLEKRGYPRGFCRPER